VVNDDLESVTIEDIENHKQTTNDVLLRDLSNLKQFAAKENTNSFYGNSFQYHFQFKNLLRCKREGGRTIYDYWNNPELWNKLLADTRKRNRGGKSAASNIYECFRINTGSVVMFKAATAKFLYKKYGATSILDPFAGWGGRMLGAWGLGIDYIGIDTNIEMKTSYESMIQYLDEQPTLSRSLLRVVWDSCLNVDFSKIDYDFVLTSPPYINMELYEHMSPWESKECFYKNLLIPVWKNCVTHIKKSGHVAFNISPKMYEEAMSFGLPKCDIEEDLKQQLGQYKNKKKQDKVYIWRNNESI